MAAKPSDDMPRYDLSELSVLFLEQHSTMRSLMRQVLRELGIRKLQDADNPNNAYQHFKRSDYDLVLTDWAPMLDGMSLLKNIRNDPASPNQYVPVIVITAHTDIDRVYAARDLGMTEFLAKPISAKLLYGRIRAVIENKRSFVKSDDFFGPDRRRKLVEFDGEDKRKGDATDGDTAAA